MADFREIPTATYDYEISKLVGYYEKALTEITGALNRLDLTDMQRANLLAVQSDVANIMKELDGKASEWVAENIPTAVTDGVIRSIMALGVADTVEEAKSIVKFNRINRELVKAAVADTQSDLLQVSQNVSRKVRTAIRQTTAEVLRSNLTQGINATQSLKRDIIRELRKQLGDSINTGIIDASNRRWKPQVYVEMVVKTKMAAAQREAAINEGVANEAYYGVISRHGAIDACRGWEGRVISLVPNASGGYPYIGDLPRRQIFHPNCRHVVTPVRRLENLPDDLKQLNGVIDQAPIKKEETVRAKPLDLSQSETVKQVIKDPTSARKLGDGGEDMTLKTLLREQGFDKRGSLVSKSELDSYVEKGERELFRGVTSENFANQFRDGDLFAGLGRYGNGTYTAYGSGSLDNNGLKGAEGIKTARDYAGPSGSIIRMSLKANAKVIKYDDLVIEAMDYEDLLAERLRKAKTKKAREAIEAEKLIAKDFGRLATIKGYDAIDVVGEKYMVILNRTSLRIQTENFNLKGDISGYNIK